MKAIIHFFCIILSFSQISCEDDLQIPLQSEESKLVINSLLGVDSLIQVHVGSSFLLQGEVTNSNLTDADVSLYQNEQFLGTLLHEKNGWYVLPGVFLKANQSYQIQAKHSGFDLVSAKSETLEKVEILNLDFNENKENGKLIFTLKFHDDPNLKNYYMILLKARNKNTPIEFGASNIEFYSDELIFNGNLSASKIGIEQNMLRGSRTFSDNSFNGQDLEISIFTTTENIGFPNDAISFQVELYHITLDYYNYERSYVAFENRKDNPIFNKVNLHSNVSGGYGIFTTFALDHKNIELGQQ